MTNTTIAGLATESLTNCLTLVQDALEDFKAKNITVLDVGNLTEVMERIVIAEGTSITSRGRPRGKQGQTIGFCAHWGGRSRYQ